MIKGFVLANHRPVANLRVAMPIDMMGLGLTPIQYVNDKLFLKHFAKRVLWKPEASWNWMLNYYIKKLGGMDYFLTSNCDLHLLPVGIKIPVHIKQKLMIIQRYRELDQHPIRNRINLNKDILVNGRMILNPDIMELGINQLDDFDAEFVQFIYQRLNQVKPDVIYNMAIVRQIEKIFKKRTEIVEVEDIRRVIIKKYKWAYLEYKELAAERNEREAKRLNKFHDVVYYCHKISIIAEDEYLQFWFLNKKYGFPFKASEVNYKLGLRVLNCNVNLVRWNIKKCVSCQNIKSKRTCECCEKFIFRRVKAIFQ